MRQFFKNNGLSIVLFTLFFFSLVGQYFTGYKEYNEENQQHRKPTVSHMEYFGEGHFIEAVFENWESEFLQMGMYVKLYQNSLSIALFTLFALSFIMHAVGGAKVYNQDQAEHGETEKVTTVQYIGTSRFWFESFQNWQSEFLSIGMMVVLSIFLRQKGSPESKPVDASYDDTGNS
ncbi:MAG: hypothetical protein LC778_03925 [Acidobacteria bacterium]|nr:hypothetical protein [Acidobacteriota bacterium]